MRDLGSPPPESGKGEGVPDGYRTMSDVHIGVCRMGRNDRAMSPRKKRDDQEYIPHINPPPPLQALIFIWQAPHQAGDPSMEMPWSSP